MTTASKIRDIFHTHKVEGILIIHRHASKEIRYTALGKEVSIDTDRDTRSVIILVKDTKKILLRIKGDDLQDIESAIEKNIPFLDVVSPDIETCIAPVGDMLESDERHFSVGDIDSDFLMKQWETVRDAPYHPNVSIESFVYGVQENEKEFFNSYGAHKRHATSHTSYGLELYYQSETFSDVHADQKYSDTNESVSLSFAREVHDYLIQKSDPKPPTIESGRKTITLRNDVVISFLDILTEALTGENIRQHTSFFSIDDIGKQVLDPRLTLLSNPAREGSPFNRLFDSEGVTSEPLLLIENGVVRNIFLDTKNAGKLALPHTGNPGVANLELISEPDSSYLKNSKFLFTNLMAFHTVNSISGKFALEGEGFEIVDGKLGNYIKNISLSGNVRDLFSSIEALGDDIYTHGNIFAPSITFRNQSVVV